MRYLSSRTAPMYAVVVTKVVYRIDQNSWYCSLRHSSIKALYRSLHVSEQITTLSYLKTIEKTQEYLSSVNAAIYNLIQGLRFVRKKAQIQAKSFEDISKPTLNLPNPTPNRLEHSLLDINQSDLFATRFGYHQNPTLVLGCPLPIPSRPGKPRCKASLITAVVHRPAFLPVR